MMAHPPITLRYFDARGRAQFLRYYLLVRGIRFADERVPLSADFAAWHVMREDHSLTGPFQKLPVLQFGDTLVAETLTISAFLHEHLGDRAALSAEDDLRHAMLTSSVCNDVMMPLGILLWAEVTFPGADLGALAKRTLERLQQHLLAVERTLVEWQWLERARDRAVMLADCALWEELSVAARVFGAHWSLVATPTLAEFQRAFAARPVCEQLLTERPCPITARPGEAAAITKIQELLG
jgi:glutathione S-transferase